MSANRGTQPRWAIPQYGEVLGIVSLHQANRKERDAYRATHPG
jgi:hypothetical protein